MKTAVSSTPRTWAGIFRTCCTVFLVLLAASAQARQHQIQVGETGFTPKHLIIFIGDTVQWVNNTAYNAVLVSGMMFTPDPDPMSHYPTAVASIWDPLVIRLRPAKVLEPLNPPVPWR